ncbi:putative minor capsid protein [Eel River basin pequenovirus]|nr:putative minor capsid protein [Eel River basin pequenovirus]
MFGPMLGAIAGGVTNHFLGQQTQGQGTADTPVPTTQQLTGQAGNAVGGMIGKGLGRAFDNMMEDRFAVGEAKRAGKMQNAYMDEFAPDMTQWERMGAQSQGIAQMASVDKQTKSAERIAKINAASADNVARIQAAPAQQQADTAEKEAASRINNLDQDTQNKIYELAVLAAQAWEIGERAEAMRLQNELGELFPRSKAAANLSTPGAAGAYVATQGATEGDDKADQVAVVGVVNAARQMIGEMNPLRFGTKAFSKRSRSKVVDKLKTKFKGYRSTKPPKFTGKARGGPKTSSGSISGRAMKARGITPQ